MILAVRESAAVISVSGADARRYLQSQLSNDIANLAVGSSCNSLLLEPVGRVVALFRVVCVADDLFMIEFDTAVDESVVGAVVARLSKFMIRTKAVIEVANVDIVRVRSTTDDPIPSTFREVPNARPAWWCDGRAIDIVGEADLSEELSSVADSTTDRGPRLEAERVRVGWPANGREIVTGETIPASLGVVPVTVSFTKGCYPGQELVERMDSRGSTAPRTLRLIEGLDSAIGDDITIDGAVVGVVTSVGDDRVLGFVDRAIDLGVRVSPRSSEPG
ncbi:MAG: hypothetical protein FJW09_06565 [Actinobacteria bacterium]|nr:hypothetical protein [Actinomycetota bacterium]